MATMKFGSKTTGDTSGPASVENGELQRETASTPAVVETLDKTLANPMENAGFTGAWNRQDVRLPRVNLVHKTSDNDLIKKFGIGSFAFNKEVKLSDGETPIIITALRAAKDYIQKLPYDSPEQPTVYSTPEEVEQNGGSLNYKDLKSGNFFQPRAHIQLITALPEGASEENAALFPYEFEGVSYGMAILTVASSAYTSVGKELATLCTNNKVMRSGMQHGLLQLTSETRSNAKNSWHVPVIKYAGETPAKLVAFFAGLL